MPAFCLHLFPSPNLFLLTCGLEIDMIQMMNMCHRVGDDMRNTNILVSSLLTLNLL